MLGKVVEMLVYEREAMVTRKTKTRAAKPAVPKSDGTIKFEDAGEQRYLVCTNSSDVYSSEDCLKTAIACAKEQIADSDYDEMFIYQLVKVVRKLESPSEVLDVVYKDC